MKQNWWKSRFSGSVLCLAVMNWAFPSHLWVTHKHDEDERTFLYAWWPLLIRSLPVSYVRLVTLFIICVPWSQAGFPLKSLLYLQLKGYNGDRFCVHREKKHRHFNPTFCHNLISLDWTIRIGASGRIGGYRMMSSEGNELIHSELLRFWVLIIANSSWVNSHKY